MNKKVVSIGFVLLLFIISLINILQPQRTFSENESRRLQKLPVVSMDNIFSGRYTTQFEKYTSDQFVGRDGWTGIKTLAELTMLKKDNGRVYFGKNGTLFDATETVDEKQLINNAGFVREYIKSVRKELPEVNESVMLVPTASEIYSDLLPAFAPIPDQQAAINKVKAVFGDDVALYDPTNLLNSSKGEYLYYRTDHHWTTHAAYIVYTDWAQKNGIKPLTQADFDIIQLSDLFYGTLHSKANLYTIKPDSVMAYRFTDAVPVSANYGSNNVSNSLYFKEYLETKDKYSYFLGENRPLIEITTATKNGKTLMFIQDSYAHCFIPFLTSHYENILVLDPRHLDTDYKSYAVKNKVTDILVLYNLPNFSVEKTLKRLVM
ncbi:MAG: DHHW family protein [Oscillospiraceae bacterium]|nr:DHHW family protein [Oscillospiraceae bacterium]